MFLWGAFGFLAWCIPQPLARTVARKLAPLRFLAIALIVITLVAMLPLKTVLITGQWHSATDADTLRTVLVATSIGTAWWVDAAGAALLILCLLLPARRRPAATALAAGLVLFGLVFTGHARMHEGVIGYLQQLNDLVHVLASGAWVGALVPLIVLLRHFPWQPGRNDHVVALDRFSLLGRWAVVLILLTGAANTWLIVGGWPLDWTSGYQMLLVVKIILVIIMVGLATTNHFRLVPKLARTPLVGATQLRRNATAELALGLAAILLVAVFGMLMPTSM